MTVIFEIENTSDAEVKFPTMFIEDVYFNTKDKKYPVLKDTEGKFLATTITYDFGKKGYIFNDEATLNSYLELDGSAKKIGWVKFQAPAAAEWPLELSMPGVTPFLLNKPQ